MVAHDALVVADGRPLLSPIQLDGKMATGMPWVWSNQSTGRWVVKHSRKSMKIMKIVEILCKISEIIQIDIVMTRHDNENTGKSSTTS